MPVYKILGSCIRTRLTLTNDMQFVQFIRAT